jgi:PAS domain S-box-containing protein
MSQPLKILLIDNSPYDRNLVPDALEKEGEGFELTQAASQEDFEAAMAEGGFETVLSELNVPGFEGLQVLDAVHAKDPELPVVIVTGSGSEEFAAEAMGRGAAGYVIKTPSHLQRLPGIILAVLEKRRQEQEHKRTEQAVARNEARLRAIADRGWAGIAAFDQNGQILYYAASNERLTGYSLEERRRIPMSELIHPDELEAALAGSRELFANPGAVYASELRFRHKNGSWIWMESITQNLLHDPQVQAIVSTVRDITERKQSENRVRYLTRLYAVLSQVSQTIVRVKQREELFQAVCRVAVEYGGFRMAWVGLVDEASGRLIPQAHSGYEEGYLQAIDDNVRDARLGEGPAGVAFRTGRAAFIDNIETSPQMQPWSEAALGRGYHSTAAVPLRFRDHVVGLLNLFAAEVDFFNEKERGLLEEIGMDISFALDSMEKETERARAQEELQKAEEKYRHIFENAVEAIHQTTPDGRYITVNPAAARMLGYDSTAELMASMNDLDRNFYVLPGRRAEFKRLVESQDALWGFESEVYRKDGSTMWVLENGRAVRDEQGNILYYEGTSEDITQRKQAEETIRRQLDYLTALREIDDAIISSFDLRVSLNTLLMRAVSLLQVDAASVLLMNKALLTLEYGGGIGFRTRAVQSTSVKLGESPAGRALTERRIIEIPNLADRQSNLFLTGFLKDEGFASYYGAPLIVKGKAVGVLEVFNRSPVQRDEQWLSLFAALAGQAAIAIDNARLFEELQRSNQELNFAYDATIEGWSRALDLRGKETEGHTLRVTERTLELGRLLGLVSDDLVHMRRGALLHDIGKLGIPDGILLKPGPLTEEEWILMKKHPILAYEMLSPIRYLEPAMEIPYCHHEKWDGTGYPRGLRAEQIPLAARIFAVVEVWDALTSDRPHRKAWTEEQALEYIRSQVGTHFDPRVVQAFLEEWGWS